MRKPGSDATRYVIRHCAFAIFGAIIKVIAPIKRRNHLEAEPESSIQREVAMIGDSIRSVIHLVMLRKTEKNLARGAERRVDILAPGFATQSRPLRAYVSFAHSDADFAHSLSTTLLQRHGLAAFVKKHSPRDSHYLDRVIPMAIETADVFIVLLSPATMKSNYLGRELQLAFRTDRQIVPVYIETLDLEAPWPQPFDDLRGITALHLEEFSVEEVAEKIARLMAAEASASGAAK